MDLADINFSDFEITSSINSKICDELYIIRYNFRKYGQLAYFAKLSTCSKLYFYKIIKYIFLSQRG